MFGIGAIAVATKGSARMGSFCVVKSTRLDPANGGSLGTIVLFPPVRAAEAQEYSAILVRVDASRLPASPLDAARITALEVLSSKTLDDIDSEVLSSCCTSR